MAYGEPDWATPGNASAGASTESTMQAAAVNTGAANSVQSKDRSKLYQSLISILIMGLCGSMTALGVFVIMENLKVKLFEEWFVASYMIIFSVLLFLYEIMWWCTIGPLNRVLRKNFGFMYKIYGKALYIILVSCLCFGIEPFLLKIRGLDWLRWCTGISWAAMGVGLMAIKCCAPQVFLNYAPPMGGIVSKNPTFDENVV